MEQECWIPAGNSSSEHLVATGHTSTETERQTEKVNGGGGPGDVVVILRILGKKDTS